MIRERLVIHGGASYPGSIGQTCLSIDVSSNEKMYRLMVDAGLEFQPDEKRGDEIGSAGLMPDWTLLGSKKPTVDVLMHTHSHFDHMGAQIPLEASGHLKPEARVVGAPQTLAMMPIVHRDYLKHNPGYQDFFDCMTVLNRRMPLAKPGECEIMPGLTLFFKKMGHLCGNCGIVIPTASGKKGLIMSDACWEDRPTVKSAEPASNWPREWLPDEIWETDLTYGPANGRPSTKSERERLVDRTQKAIAEDKKVIICALGNGRGQDLALDLADAGIKCYLDGMISDVFNIYRENNWPEQDDQDPRLPDLGETTGIVPIKNREHRNELLKSPDPVVIITTGGMGNFGPCIIYFLHGLERKDFAFFFTSWLSPGSNGQKLVKRAKQYQCANGKFYLKHVERKHNGRDEVLRMPLYVKAEIEHFRDSGHCTLDDVVTFIKEIVELRGKPLLRIILTHGSQSNKSLAAVMMAPYASEIIFEGRNTVIAL